MKSSRSSRPASPSRPLPSVPLAYDYRRLRSAAMKLDIDALRYLSKDDFRVLTAVEMGMRNVCRSPPCSAVYMCTCFICRCVVGFDVFSPMFVGSSTRLFPRSSSIGLQGSSELHLAGLLWPWFAWIVLKTSDGFFLLFCVFICDFRHGGTYKVLKNLLKHKLLHHDSSKCEYFVHSVRRGIVEKLCPYARFCSTCFFFQT